MRTLLLVAVLMFTLCADAVSQDSQRPYKNVLSLAFQYQSMMDSSWNIAYFGGSLELDDSTAFSASGSVYFGRGSDDAVYIHLPAAGFILLVPFFAANYFGGEVSPSLLRILYVENLHYNFNVADRIVLSPYIHLLGFDLGPGEPEQIAAGQWLTSGLGMSGKFFLSDHLVLVPDVSFKRYFVFGVTAFTETFGSQDRWGYAAGIRAGYVF